MSLDNLGASIAGYNTLSVHHRCRSVTEVESVIELQAALQSAADPIILGGGSNVLFTTDIDRDVIIMNNRSIEIINTEKDHVVVEFGAGTKWTDAVDWALDNNYGGIENLSLIPGKCGAAPIQNIGAYGVELCEVFNSLESINRANLSIEVFDKESCEFGYRNSVFKNRLKNHFVITSIRLRLTKNDHKIRDQYGAIKTKIADYGIDKPTIKDISRAVVDIRTSKLPDPLSEPNAGSFFKNPVIPGSEFIGIQKENPQIPFYQDGESYKIPAAWLIEHVGWKGKSVDHVATYRKHALVIVNMGTKNGRDILEFSKRIQQEVYDRFAILLEREVNVF